MPSDVNRAVGVVTSGEYAAHRGCSPAYISKLKRQGKLAVPAVLQDGRINVILADQMLGAPGGQLEMEPPVPDPFDAGPNYAKERAGREAAQRQLAEITLAEKQGNTLSRQAADRDAFNVNRRLRDRILAVPARIADELAAQSNARLVAFRLSEALNEALGEVAEALLHEAEEVDAA